MQQRFPKSYFWYRTLSRGCTGGKLHEHALFLKIKDGKPVRIGVAKLIDLETVYVDWYESLNGDEPDIYADDYSHQEIPIGEVHIEDHRKEHADLTKEYTDGI